jgi:DNA polymerase-4
MNSRAQLHEASLGLIRSVLPAAKGVRLIGVTLSNFVSGVAEPPLELSLLPG